MSDKSNRMRNPNYGIPKYLNPQTNFSSHPNRPNQKLLDILQEQRVHGHIDLNDKYIGDEGASLLANFLRQNTHVKTLLLRGNKITSSGFASICAALSLNSNLTKLSAEWNDIGLDSKGLAALYEYARSANHLRSLDLRNNSINGLDVEPLARLIEETKSLNEINLSFNSLGNKGGNLIANSLKNNKTIFSMNVAGNNISETIVSDIDNCLRANSKLVDYNKIERGGVQESDYMAQTLNMRRGFGVGDRKGNGAIDEDYKGGEGRRVVDMNTNGIAFAETVLNEERRRGIETREVMANQIDDLMKKDLQGAQIVRELESKYYEALEHLENEKRENEKLREDYLKSRDQVNLMELRYEERIKNLEFQLHEREKNEKLMMDKMLTEHNVAIKEINRDWGSRLEEIEQKSRAAVNTKEDLEIELQRVLDSVNIIKQEHALEVKELIERIKDEEYNKYEEKLLALNARINALEEAREEYARRLSEENREGQHREKKLQENILKLEAELNHQNSENVTLKGTLDEYRETNNKFKADLVSKDLKIGNLERENNELHQILNNKKENHTSEIDNLLQEHKRERISWDNLREEQHHKIQELERLLRLNEMEIQRMRQDYQKLADILQTNVTKAIYQTFVGES